MHLNVKNQQQEVKWDETWDLTLLLDVNVVGFLLIFAGLQVLCSFKMLINSYNSASVVYWPPVRLSLEIKLEVCEDFLNIYFFSRNHCRVWRITSGLSLNMRLIKNVWKNVLFPLMRVGEGGIWVELSLSGTENLSRTVVGNNRVSH